MVTDSFIEAPLVVKKVLGIIICFSKPIDSAGIYACYTLKFRKKAELHDVQACPAPSISVFYFSLPVAFTVYKNTML